jgi:hypothetical protein
MSLVEIERFTDVYEAELAAAFLTAHGLPVSLTERFQTTVDPLMQRALGVRLMGPASCMDEARDLLVRARSGEFASDEADDLPKSDSITRATATLMALALFGVGTFWGSSMPRRLRPVHWIGLALVAGLLALTVLAVVLLPG